MPFEVCCTEVRTEERQPECGQVLIMKAQMAIGGKYVAHEEQPKMKLNLLCFGAST
jgi:hypothetical protein